MRTGKISLFGLQINVAFVVITLLGSLKPLGRVLGVSYFPRLASNPGIIRKGKPGTDPNKGAVTEGDFNEFAIG